MATCASSLDSENSFEEYQSDFHRQHGESVIIDGGGRLLFADGALWDFAQELGIDPPPDDLGRFRLLLRYQETRAAKIAALFNRIRGLALGEIYSPVSGYGINPDDWERAIGSAPTPTSDAVADLLILRERHAEHRQIAREYRERIKNHPTILAERVTAARTRLHDRLNQLQTEDARKKIRAITLDDYETLNEGE